jgi:parallel beta-helix repeat protein
MKRQAITTRVLLATAMSILSTGVASADTIYVPDDHAAIQWAVDNTTGGDTIIVRDGTYHENVDISKQLTIRSEHGAASCTVNASDPYDHVFEILSNSVVINGFTVRNATGSSMVDWKNAGTHVTDSDYVNISDCVVENNVFGIRTTFSYYLDITRNIVRDNTYGIYLASSPNATLTENTLSNNRVRNLDTSGTNSDSHRRKHNIDTTNTVNGKPVYYYIDSNDGNGNGIRVQYGVDNWIENNTLKRNYMGAYVEGCENSTIHNRLEDNSYGCWLYNQNRILDNTIQGSEYHGLNIMGGENQVAGNTILDNDNTSWSCGISFSGSSSNNLIYNNYFDNPNNTHDDGANTWNTTNTTGPNIVGGSEIGGNYGSDYEGDDTDDNGFGDETYNIVGGSNQDYLPLVYAPATCGDITGDGTIDTVDLLRLLKYVVTGTQIDPCVGDIDGNGHINVLDVRLLVGHINNPGGYSLHCEC